MVWDEHINFLKAKITSGIGTLYKFKNKWNSEAKMLTYQVLIHSHLTYLPIIYGCEVNKSLKSLQSAQNKALKLVFNLPNMYSTLDLYKKYATNILSIRSLYEQKFLVFVYKTINSNEIRNIQFTPNI